MLKTATTKSYILFFSANIVESKCHMNISIPRRSVQIAKLHAFYLTRVPYFVPIRNRWCSMFDLACCQFSKAIELNDSIKWVVCWKITHLIFYFIIIHLNGYFAILFIFLTWMWRIKELNYSNSYRFRAFDAKMEKPYEHVKSNTKDVCWPCMYIVSDFGYEEVTMQWGGGWS